MKNIVRELDEIITIGLFRTPLPVVKGNSVRIGSIVIRKSKTHGYIVLDCLENKQLCHTYSKKSAIAVAQRALKRESFHDILSLDKIYEKHHIDSIFYNYTIEKTDSDARKYANLARLEVSLSELNAIERRLENIIFNQKR